MSELPKLYNDEEERLMRVGARLILMKLLQTVNNGWNGYGTKLWAEQQIERLEDGHDTLLLG